MSGARYLTADRHHWWCGQGKCARVQDTLTLAYVLHTWEGTFLRICLMQYEDDPVAEVDVSFVCGCFDHWTDALALAGESLRTVAALAWIRRPGYTCKGSTDD